jgi:tetratricopeptide (TPR) repeat protein
MFRLKTPHAAPIAHMLRMFGYFLGSTALIGILFQSTLSIPSVTTVVSLLVTASLSLVIGLVLTIVIRRLANLTQTGRILQYASFWLGSFCAVLLASTLFPGAVWHYSPALESLLIFAFAFGPATYFTEVPWKGRTWLPVAKKRKNRQRDSVFFQHAWLRIKAELFDNFGTMRKSRRAWQLLVDFEEVHLPARSSRRSRALMELARSFTTGQRDQHLIALELLHTAYENIVNDKGEKHHHAADALQMLGDVQGGLANTEESLRYHQDAEAIYLEARPLSLNRARNLQALARAYSKLGDWRKSEWCTREATIIRSVQLLYPRRVTGSWR